MVVLAAAVVVAGGIYLARSGPGSAPAPAMLSSVELESEPTPTEVVAPQGRPDEPIAEGPTRTEVEAAGIRGRVVEADGEVGLAGIEVELTSYRDTVASTVTGEDGSFALPWSDLSALAVQVVEAGGWKAVRRRQRLRGDEPPAEELLFELRRDTRSPFLGRAVDERTGQPLAFLRLAVGKGGIGSEFLQTDAEGLFETRPLEPGDLVVCLTEGDTRVMLSDTERAVTHDGSDVRHDISLAVGPTYDLRVVPPPDHELGDLRAYLETEPEPQPWYLKDEWSSPERLHEDAVPWVRFAEPPSGRDEDADVRLWITTEDGRWLGSAEVPRRSARGDGPYPVTLSPCGSIDGRVETAEGERLDSASVDLAVRNPGERRVWKTRRVKEGRFRFELVPPGDYVLTVSNDRFERLQQPFQVAAGDATQVELVLQPLSTGGEISGVVRSRSGRFRVADTVHLSSRAEVPHRSFSARVTWEQEQNELVGRFAFEDVPVGEYELEAWSWGRFPWTPSPLIVSSPSTDLELVCEDGVGGIVLEVELFDQRTGEPLNEFDFSTHAEEGGGLSFGMHGSNRNRLGRYRRGLELSWMASSSGYVAKQGDLSAFVEVGTVQDEPLLRARIELEPGWGGPLVVGGPDGNPVEGARVLCDGVEVGRTDERGFLRLVLPERPKHFEVLYEGMVMRRPAPGEVPDVRGGPLEVRMKRAE